ncbi:efflux RND transporter periplasmic adaptor subunit [cf. Phormidesmis sp. LEGE 11477]|uniref:efflux RND transporter periplasmic adaptor subunit n=1 Tax=cf. Phormidesmis sp. LEGE 11477 TaxID=1828680 RepID=UPI00187E75DF|nr:efflux RND transporter periplasmic adaptor subunit [cf. Phormidesmis sp. LEGE 11477]MBE9059510.1 efflux RND transporter periplasmic adaptor subunit [cf. Phormidesmis sp. LEGE 11477]
MSSANISSPQLPESEPESEQQQEKHSFLTGKLPGWFLAILLIGGGVIGGGVILWQVFVTGSAQTAESGIEAPPPTSVETTVLASGAGNRQVRLLGQVEAGERATLSPQLDGTVHSVSVREGDRVTPGMTVAVLDDADSRLALAEARARLAQERSNLARLQVGTRPEILAQREAELDAARTRELAAQDNLERISNLTEQGALSQRDLIEASAEASAARSEKYRVEALLAEAQAGATQEETDAQQGLVDAANAAVEQAQLSMQRTEIKAAFSGIVQSREVDPGDYVEVSDSVLTIVSDRTLDIFLELPESLSGQVAPGMSVTLNARALPDWQQATRITAVVPTADTASRRQRVRVSLDDPPPRLVPGMAIQASLTMPIDSVGSFVAPRDALTRRGDEWLLFMIENDRARELEVEIVADLGQEVVIANSELREGQIVVITGGDGLANDAAVQVVN